MFDVFFCSDAFRFHIFAKMCSPLEPETHFRKPTLSNQPSKIHFYGALHALNDGSVGHLFGTYRPFARSVRLFSASVAHQNFNLP